MKERERKKERGSERVTGNTYIHTHAMSDTHLQREREREREREKNKWRSFTTRQRCETSECRKEKVKPESRVKECEAKGKRTVTSITGIPAKWTERSEVRD